MINNMTVIPNIDPATMLSFAFVCDGEVAFVIKMPPTNEHFVAVLQSNPIVVEYTNNEAAIGDLYKDGKFIKP